MKGRTHGGKIVAIVVAISLVAGMVLYSRAINIYEKIRVLNEIISIVNENYVESVDWDDVLDGAFYGLLEELDPHSAYIPRDRLVTINEQFHGKFEGIGIEFDILGGYITVISPIVGSPSDRAGLQPGDQIVKINGEDAFKITQEEVFDKLRGPKGTSVDITVRRPGMDQTFDVQIIRDQVPIRSVTAAFLLDERTGYIKLHRFSATTSQEVREALDRLVSDEITRLVFDLRSNSGGFLQQAVEVADYFITTEDTLVYTDGRKREAREVYLANPNIGSSDFAVIVLINRWSASASEIVAGAIQDLDRGLIVGETSFGKGLVQRQWTLRDESALRVTIARYYTPSGRLIQRPYDGGTREYYEELADTSREAALDSLKATRPRYTTKSGREVYGGGGITPDVYIPTHYLSETTSIIVGNPERFTFNWGTEFAAAHRDEWSSVDAFSGRFELTDTILADFQRYVEKRGVSIDGGEFAKDADYLKRLLKAEIGGAVWGRKMYYQVLMAGDPQMRKAVQYFDRAKEFLAEQ